MGTRSESFARGDLLVKPETLLEYAAGRLYGDAVQARRVLAFVLSWDAVAQALGREPSTQEFADWWGVERTQPPRQLRRFRQAFPEFASPTELKAAIERHAPGTLSGGVSALAEVRWPRE